MLTPHTADIERSHSELVGFFAPSLDKKAKGGGRGGRSRDCYMSSFIKEGKNKNLISGYRGTRKFTRVLLLQTSLLYGAAKRDLAQISNFFHN